MKITFSIVSLVFALVCTNNGVANGQKDDEIIQKPTVRISQGKRPKAPLDPSELEIVKELPRVMIPEHRSGPKHPLSIPIQAK
jgi:hypothetical protein